MIAVASIVLWSLLWIQSEYSDFKAESQLLRSKHIKSQKALIKKETTNLIKHIKVLKAKAENELKYKMKERVYTAHKIASNIYKENIESKTPYEIEKMIKDALRPIRFDNGHGYYFAVSMEGVEILYPIKPEFEGKNLINLKDSKGNFVIQDEIYIVKEYNEGFVTHYWIKPETDPDKLFPKTSFVKHFKPLNLYIGTGSYLDEAKNQIQQQLLARLAVNQFGADGYFFGTTYKGDSLFSNGEVTLDQDNIWNLTDPNGVKFTQEQRKAVENPNGGFVYYSWRKLKDSNPSPKVSFMLGIPEWEWMIGAGVYLDNIEKSIFDNKALMESHLKKRIIRSIFVLIVLLTLIWFWSKRILKQVQKSINVFSSFLKKASTDSITIDPDRLELQEFKEIAILTNEMLTNRIQAEEAMQESEEKFRGMYEFTQIGIARVSLNSKIIQANNAYCNILGYSEKELIEKTIKDITYPDDIQENIELQAKLQHGKIDFYQMEKRFIHKNGNTVHGMLSGTLIRDKHKNPHYFLENVIDITPIKEAKENKKELEVRLQHAQKMEAIGSLAGGIAHDFNNVLFSIIGFTELTIVDMPEDNKDKSNLNQVLIAANRAKEMVQQILAFSRQTETEKKPVNIQSIIKEVVKLLKSSIPSTIEIKVNIDKNCKPAFADPGQIHQVIMNLATNASYAMKERGGVMEFALKQKEIISEDLSIYPNLHTGTYIKLTVTDTGQGIENKIMGKIFNPYFTTKKVGEGTGMGLSVVHGIISDHEGDIIAESQPEKGASFHIFLPIIEKTLSTNQDNEQNITSSAQIPTGTENILFIDDEKQIAIMTKQFLERLGYNVTSHTDSQKALNAFKKEPDKFDIVITDMTMPIMTGTELATKLFKIKPDVKIILCSGYSELIDKKTAQSMGIKEYITKPITQKKIAETIRTVLKEEEEL
ncbi:MAG: cache domain-containing protein [Desulfobacterales bacterium]|nr:cache domain-containing protein [Desulfobacterales bacterium]